jgi:hypothetical protein
MRGFFRFPPAANEMAGELPTRPACLPSAPEWKRRDENPAAFACQCPLAALFFCRARRENMFSTSTSAEKAMAA